MTDDLLDLIQMAFKSKKAPLTVRRAVWTGALPAVRCGRKIMATTTAFKAWKKAGCPTSLPGTVVPYRMVPRAKHRAEALHA